MRTASSIRPGSAMPPTQAAPPAKASAWAAGRSCFANSRCQPQALKAYAMRKRSAEATTSSGSAWWSGQPMLAKWLQAEDDDDEQHEAEAAVEQHLDPLVRIASRTQQRLPLGIGGRRAGA